MPSTRAPTQHGNAMNANQLLPPTEYVWHPTADAGSPEPDPPTPRVRSICLGRAVEPCDITRTVLVETVDGFEPLARRIELHGDPDEGWDWGWRGSAPLETALNALLYFIHPRAAWRLQWAFCEAFLHRLPPSGGVLDGDEIRSWIHANWWIGRQNFWTTTTEAAPLRVLARDRAVSRRLSPRARAEMAGQLIRQPAARAAGRSGGPRLTGREHERAAAVLAGAPPAQRWATMAILASLAPRPGSPAYREWSRRASPATPGLPDPDTLRAVAAVWSKLVGKSAPERGAIVAECIHEHAASNTDWASIPLLAFALGAGFSSASEDGAQLAGDPVAIAGTTAALSRAMQGDASLTGAAASTGITAETLEDLIRTAHERHVDDLRDERRAVEKEAAEVTERVLAANRARLPRGRSPRPPPSSDELRRWVLAAPIALLTEVVRAAAGPAGPLTLRAAMREAGLAFPDPAGTIGQTVAWYLEERAPALLDMPTFLVRGEGMIPQTSST